ncbi:sensor histidine kinase [Candidatus Oscillochloris fontis]|uniref:sensor histidine kinase n=1 Tax=Candidatus Oscillochloris fontis TaxID=2496868 RepID=UPI00101D6316|nr:sensor histidine kinase [Candidatus Oscillochloris fontis]
MSSAENFSLPALLGLGPKGCLLELDQVRDLAVMLMRSRPPDMRAGCFIGGRLSVGKHTPTDAIVLAEGFGSAPFLVIAGQQGASALLTWAESGHYRTQIITDPEYVDRAALVLAQLSDHEYSMRDLVEAEVQRAYVARLAATLIGELQLTETDRHALMPNESRWLHLAVAMANRSGAEALLSIQEVRQLFQEMGIQRAILGHLDGDQHQFIPLASEGGPIPAPCTVQTPGMIANVIHRGRVGTATSAPHSGLQGIASWMGNNVLTAVPLLRNERVGGLLLVASPRPIPTPGQALLSGIASLIALNMSEIASSTASRSNENGSKTARTLATATANRSTSTRDGSHIVRELGSLLTHLDDAIMLVDGRGQVTDYTPAMAELLGIDHNTKGQPLIASGAACLSSLLAEALMEDAVEAQEIELPNGRQASASVIGFSQGLWAFVLRPQSKAERPEPVVVAAPAAAIVPESERNESFLANFSNIIRVPLRELRELITRVPAAGELNEQQSRLIGQVVRLNSELTMLVNDLLSLGQIRLQTGDNRVMLRLDLLIEAAVGTQYAEFGRRGQEVETDIQAKLPRVYGSEEGLGRAISALIDNAIKYSPSGAHIRVSAKQEGKMVIVQIKDSGPGLRPDELAQIFDPFYRAATTEHMGVSGRGLGLTIAKAVIEQHDGSIWAEGEPEQGCTFTFQLPTIESSTG